MLNMKDMIIKKANLDSLNPLRDISIQTFVDTFGSMTDSNDMRDYVSKAFTKDNLAFQIDDPNSNFYFMLKDGKLAGYLKVNKDDAQTEKFGNNSLEVERIYLQKDFQHQGLGTTFIDAANQIAKNNQKEYMWLGVWEANEPAKKFYKKQGFNPFSHHYFQLGSEKQRHLLIGKKV